MTAGGLHNKFFGTGGPRAELTPITDKLNKNAPPAEKRGALLATDQGSQLVPGFAVEVVDTTGAGDAFTAALTLALAEGQPLPEAVRLGNAAGALAVTRFGTMSAMPTRAEVEAFLKSRA